MKRFGKPGFSLVEVLVVLFIFALIGTMFISIVRSASRESDFGAEHFAALQVSQKVFEDCAQEIAVNPYGLDFLGNSPQGKPVTVNDGNSPLFVLIEDRNPRDGKIDPSGINPAMVPIYDQMRGFTLDLKTVRGVAANDKGLCHSEAFIQWPAKTGKGIYSSETDFASLVSEKIIAPVVRPIDDQAAFEKAVGRSFYFDQVTPLAQLIAADHGDKDVVLAMGRVLFLSRTLRVNFLKQMDEKISTLETEISGKPDGFDKVRLLKNLEDCCFETGRASFHLLFQMKEDLAFILRNYREEKVGTYLWQDPERREGWLSELIGIWQSFFWSMKKVKWAGERLLAKELVPFQDLLSIHRTVLKLVDLYKIFYIIPDSPLQRTDFRFFEFLKSSSTARNPCLERFVGQEEGFVSRDQLLEKYPNLRRFSETMKVIKELDLKLKILGTQP